MSPRCWIKICGLTDPVSIAAAIDAKANALGFVFVSGSPRFVDYADVKAWLNAVPEGIQTVGVFVNPTANEVESAIKTGISMLQFHGHESQAFCEQFNRPYIKAVAVDASEDWLTRVHEHPRAFAILLDGPDAGSGRLFDNASVLKHRDSIQQPLIIAGGLTPDNVQAMMAHFSPFGVDVSSGVEEQRGVKSPAKIQAFCANC